PYFFETPRSSMPGGPPGAGAATASDGRAATWSMFRFDVVCTPIDHRPQLTPHELRHPLDLSRKDALALVARRPARISVRPHRAFWRRIAVERGAIDDAVVAVPQRLIFGQLLESHAVTGKCEHDSRLRALGVARVELGWLGGNPHVHVHDPDVGNGSLLEG